MSKTVYGRTYSDTTVVIDHDGDNDTWSNVVDLSGQTTVVRILGGPTMSMVELCEYMVGNPDIMINLGYADECSCGDHDSISRFEHIVRALHSDAALASFIPLMPLTMAWQKGS